jgi:hypothetical protein
MGPGNNLPRNIPARPGELGGKSVAHGGVVEHAGFTCSPTVVER